jgi:hypothetical protein
VDAQESVVWTDETTGVCRHWLITMARGPGVFACIPTLPTITWCCETWWRVGKSAERGRALLALSHTILPDRVLIKTTSYSMFSLVHKA